MNAHARNLKPAKTNAAVPALADPARADAPAGAGQALGPTPADLRLSQPAIIGSLLAADAATLLATAALSFAMAEKGIATPGAAVIIAGFVTACAILLLQRLYGYTIASLGNLTQQVSRCAGALALTFAALVAAAVLIKVDLVGARPWLLSWMLAAFAVMTLLRIGMTRKIIQWTSEGRLARRAVVVGGGKTTTELIAALARDGSKSIQILGLFDDRGGERSPDEVESYRKLGRFDQLVDFCRDNKVDLLIISLPQTAEARILHLLKKLWVLPIDIRISALDSKLKLRPRAYTWIGKVPFLSVFDKPLTDWGMAVKTAEDRLIASLALLLLSPVMALVALAVKLDSKGPVFFRQTRYGFNNEKIGVFKFRSMFVDQSDANASRLVTKGDPRVTRVGAFIRKTSLDELPQLINVLRGELSLVGPRPHAMQAKADGQVYTEVVDGYFARHKVKPGITGWAQINGWRGETDTVDKIERRVEHDLHYIDNWSVFFDLYILAMTPVSLLNTKNAY